MSVTVVIPALNEAACIARVLAAIPAALVDEVIVVDGGSTDDTVRIAREAGASVLHEPRRGYGRACATGLAAARGDIVIFLDADGADDPSYISVLLAPLRDGEADLVLGTRLAGGMAPRAMPWHQRFGNRLSAWLIGRLYGLPLTDLSPFRAAERERLLELDLEEMTYGWPTEMIVKAARGGWRITEVPVRYRSRFGGRSKISGTEWGTVLAALHILRTIVRHVRR